MDGWAYLTEDDEVRRDLREGYALALFDANAELTQGAPDGS